jgi:hypothetical protein
MTTVVMQRYRILYACEEKKKDPGAAWTLMRI